MQIKLSYYRIYLFKNNFSVQQTYYFSTCLISNFISNKKIVLNNSYNIIKRLIAYSFVYPFKNIFTSVIISSFKKYRCNNNTKNKTRCPFKNIAINET